MIFETILFERRDQVAHVTLNRPDKLNALNLQMIEDLRAAAAAIDGDPAVRAVLLTGAGRGFSSGADLMGDDLLQDPKRSAGENIGRRLRERANEFVELEVEETGKLRAEMMSPSSSTSARSITLRSSRTFPGQE